MHLYDFLVALMSIMNNTKMNLSEIGQRGELNKLQIVFNFVVCVVNYDIL